VIIAFLMATINVVRRAAHPGSWIMQQGPDGSYFIPRDSAGTPDDSGLIIYRFGAPLFFANTAAFEEDVEGLLERAPADVRCFVFDAQAMLDVDTTGAETLREVLDLLSERGIAAAISRASPRLTASLQQFGLLEMIAEDKRYPTDRHALEAYRREFCREDPGDTA
jgi:MFS superfamily sulfate permease-like transporter